MTRPAPTARPRRPLARLAGRTIWIAANLLLGHFVLFNAYFLSILMLYEEDFDRSIVFGLAASVVLVGVAVAIIAGLNAALRLLNRDMSRRVFSWTSAGICVIGAAANYVVHPYLL